MSSHPRAISPSVHGVVSICPGLLAAATTVAARKRITVVVEVLVEIVRLIEIIIVPSRVELLSLRTIPRLKSVAKVAWKAMQTHLRRGKGRIIRGKELGFERPERRNL